MSEIHIQVVPTQLLTIGRGLENASDDFPGTVQFNSPHSGDSYDRAVMTAVYAVDHPEVKTIIFSGDKTFVTPEHEVVDSTEAEAMSAVAKKHGLFKFLALVAARTTYGNMVEAAPHLDFSQPFGLVVHKDHAKRAKKIAEFVMPSAVFATILADNPNRTNFNKMTKYKDIVADTVFKIGMLGVTPGDLKTIDKRDQQVQNAVLTGLRYKSMLQAMIARRRAAA